MVMIRVGKRAHKGFFLLLVGRRRGGEARVTVWRGEIRRSKGDAEDTSGGAAHEALGGGGPVAANPETAERAPPELNMGLWSHGSWPIRMAESG
ncbi:pollen-specific leucine-rich repeat extensin-like protein 3 [Iris pallida]|uniref:Pollen-specific leucine-rich repeat extensin-like protein 3 n=1 Tax=Iris pallida TaxID=29817 RepID=A0AAX6H9F7_IRIPA|nr:pollen-specific leucine-rich repeat extensin-like protein 3 [Iris pallida]